MPEFYDRRPWLLIALAGLGLGFTLPADRLLYEIVTGQGKPDGFGSCSLLLLPALAARVAADCLRRMVRQDSAGLWVILGIPLALLWLIILAFGGAQPG
jgi:hypothetical protein